MASFVLIMKINRIISILKLALLLSFFLPFFYACDKEGSESSQPDSSQVQTDSSASRDSAALATSGEEAKSDNREEKKSILKKIWNEITVPDYGKGIAFTGFGYFLISIQCLGDSVNETGAKINSFIFILLFLSAGVLVFLPQKRKKLHLIFYGWNFIALLFYLGLETIDDHLYGYWLALVLSFIILLLLVLEKRLQLLLEQEANTAV
jgi:hypothetical protein